MIFEWCDKHTKHARNNLDFRAWFDCLHCQIQDCINLVAFLFQMHTSHAWSKCKIFNASSTYQTCFLQSIGCLLRSINVSLCVWSTNSWMHIFVCPWSTTLWCWNDLGLLQLKEDELVCKIIMLHQWLSYVECHWFIP